MIAVMSIVSLVGCLPTDDPTASPPPTITQNASLQTSTDHITLSLLPGWSVYETEGRLVLVEEATPIGEAGRLNGITVTLWIPTVSGTPSDSVSDILTTFAQQDEDSPSFAITSPAELPWDDHEAAYYLLNRGDGNASLIMLLRLPDERGYLAMNASTPADEMHRLPVVLYELCHDLTVDDWLVGNTGFDNLPDALQLPPFDSSKATQPASQPTTDDV